MSARRETLDHGLIRFEQGHDITDSDRLRGPRQHRAAPGATPGLQQASGGQYRDDLGQMMPRYPEFRRKVGSGKGALRRARKAHQHTQPVIGERGQAQDRVP